MIIKYDIRKWWIVVYKAKRDHEDDSDFMTMFLLLPIGDRSLLGYRNFGKYKMFVIYFLYLSFNIDNA